MQRPSNERSSEQSHALDESSLDRSASNPPTVESRDGIVSRLPDPMYLSLLFFLGIPGTLIPTLKWMEVFYLFGLFGFWPMLRGFLPSGGSDVDPTDWITMGTQSRRRPLISMLYLQLNPFLQLKGLFQLAGHIPVLLRYRFRLPDPDRFEQQVSYRLPVEGEWTVVGGGPTREHSHSWGMLAQRYAYDLVVTDEQGRTHEDDGDQPEDYHCYGEPLVAPADGVVVTASDGHRDYHRSGGWLDPRQRDPRGNYLTIKHCDEEYSLLAHLQQGSITVSEGDRVERGEQVARCGHSGNSTEPHLHFQLQDHPSFFRAMGLPIYFDSLRIREADGEAKYHESAYITEGQRVAPVM